MRGFAKALLTLSAVASAACGRQAVEPPTVPSTVKDASRDDYERARRAAFVTGALRHDEGKTFWYGCSGVLVEDEQEPMLLTAGHCVTNNGRVDRELVCIAYPQVEVGRQVLPPELDGFRSAGTAGCALTQHYPDIDLAVLRLRSPLRSGAKPVKFAASDPRVSEKVHGVIAPSQLINTWYVGYINAHHRGVNLAMASGFGSPLLLGVSTPVAGGASGGMVLDARGDLVGLVIANVFGMNTALALPVSEIRARLAGGPPR